MGKVTAGKMARSHFLKFRCFLGANILGIGATRMEIAAARRIGRIGDFPLQYSPFAPQFGESPAMVFEFIDSAVYSSELQGSVHVP